MATTKPLEIVILLVLASFTIAPLIDARNIADKGSPSSPCFPGPSPRPIEIQYSGPRVPPPNPSPCFPSPSSSPFVGIQNDSPCYAAPSPSPTVGIQYSGPSVPPPRA
ncbi:unnamed protein product [Amaranthus hypochondriacus]